MLCSALAFQFAGDAVLGLTFAEIAERYGVSRTTVHRNLSKLGDVVPRRRGGTLAASTVAVLQDALRTGVLGISETARLAGVGKATVWRWRKKVAADPTVPRTVDPYRCPRCRCRVIHDPCTICSVRAAFNAEN